MKRQKEVRDLSTTRLREGDSVLAVLPGSTRATVVFFTNFGAAYTSRIIDVPASTGYGEPVQKLFKLRDGERVIAACSLDPRVAGDITPKKEGAVAAASTRIAVTSDGYSLRFSLEPFVEPSTRAGRRFARPSDGVEVVGVAKITGDEIVIAATAGGARHPVPGRRGELPVRARARASSSSSSVGRGPGARLHRVDRRPRHHARRDEPRRRADDQHRRNTR